MLLIVNVQSRKFQLFAVQSPIAIPVQSSSGTVHRVEMASFTRDKPHLNVGTLGHAGHGKTTLTSAITKVLAADGLAKHVSVEELDKAKQEKASGSTINANLIEYSTANRHYGHFDCPGRANYVKNAVTGAAQMDAAILVVSLTEKLSPQAREHVIVAHQSGVTKLAVFLNKLEEADDDLAQLMELEARELAKSYGYDGDNLPVVSGSALCALRGERPEIGESRIRDLLKALDEQFPIPERDLDKPAYMPIGRVFDIAGRGVVVTGRLERGALKQGDEIELKGFDRELKTTVASVETFRQSLERGESGDQLGVLLTDVKRKELRRGLVLCKAGTKTPTNSFKAEVYFLRPDEGGRHTNIRTRHQYQLLSETLDVPAVIELPAETEFYMPGDNGTVYIHTQRNVVIEDGQKIMLREGGMVACGLITELRQDDAEAHKSWWEKKKEKRPKKSKN